MNAQAEWHSGRINRGIKYTVLYEVDLITDFACLICRNKYCCSLHGHIKQEALAASIITFAMLFHETSQTVQFLYEVELIM